MRPMTRSRVKWACELEYATAEMNKIVLKNTEAYSIYIFFSLLLPGAEGCRTVPT